MSHPYVYLGLALALAMALPQATCVDTGTLNPEVRRDAEGNSASTDIASVPASDLFEVAQRLSTPVPIPRNSQLQISLLWNTGVDLDLVVQESDGSEISEANRVSPITGGMLLRVDESGFGPEIVDYLTVPEGKYQVFVKYAGELSGDTGATGAVAGSPFYTKTRDGANAQGGGFGGEDDLGSSETGATGDTGDLAALIDTTPTTDWDVRIIFNGKVFYLEGSLDVGDQDHVATISSAGGNAKGQGVEPN